MGMLVEGRWLDDDEKRRIDASGAFVRPQSVFRDRVTRDGSSGFPAEPGRYHLFVAPNCPWAHRTMILRRMMSLEDAISVSQSESGPRTQSWVFTKGVDDIQPPKGELLELHQVYTAARPDYTGRVTVPTLWDRKKRTIVNNESSEIIRMLNTEFGTVGPDLYPEKLRAEIDEINTLTYERVNNGVYRCGFAKSQAAYEEAFKRLFDALDTLEARLSKQRFLVGNRLTEADVRLFPTLVRFDPVYHYLFKCNLRKIDDYPNLSNYTRDLFARRGFGDTVDVGLIKKGYFANAVNPTGIVPVGPIVDFTRPHDRSRFKEEK
jgi:putative glutathione S-transferase